MEQLIERVLAVGAGSPQTCCAVSPSSLPLIEGWQARLAPACRLDGPAAVISNFLCAGAQTNARRCASLQGKPVRLKFPGAMVRF